MKKYYCDCGWVGHFPNVLKTEKRDKGILVLGFQSYCPDCDAKLSDKNMSD